MASANGRAKSREKQGSEPEEDRSSRLVTRWEPSGIASEAYRSLRTNLLYALVDNPPKVIVLTSPGPSEGKSTTCANLGVVLAQAEKNTLVLDCDFRRPTLHKFFGLRNTHGITDVLAGERSLPEVYHEVREQLKVATVGPLPINPSELLGSNRFSTFLASVRQTFDFVLIDTPPIGLVSDPVVLAIQGDGVLVVLNAHNTRKVALRQSVRSLNKVGANVLGIVMNDAEFGKRGYYYYAETY